MSFNSQVKSAMSKVLKPTANGRLGLIDPDAIVTQHDLGFILEKADDRLRLWEELMGIMTTKQALNALRIKIEFHDDPKTISQNFQMIKHISKEAKAFEPVGEKIYWDMNEIFTTRAFPLKAKSIVGRISYVEENVR